MAGTFVVPKIRDCCKSSSEILSNKYFRVSSILRCKFLDTSYNCSSVRLGQLNIRALHVDKMHHNLLSVHQLCEGGESRTKQVGVFTDEGCRFFPLNHCRDALKLLSSKPQTFYGLAQNGVYIYAPSDQPK